MFPKLYNANETNFIHNGLGLLTGAVSAIAIEEINGMFVLNMEYDSEGFLADVIQEEMIIKAKANDKQDEQLFRIYSITKNHDNDNLIINARHITNDLANNFVEKLEARNLTKRQVMQLIGSSTNYDHPFNVTSSNTTTQSSTSLYRTNPLQMIAGTEGSVLQIWGGQIERDNFNLIMHDRRGSDDGVLVTYKKNLTGLTAKFDISNLVTRIFPFVFKEATDDEPEQLITVPGKYIDSPHIDDYEMPYILPVDFSSEQDIETSQDLLNVASGWFKETGRDRPSVEMEVKFEHLWETEEYKDVAALELVGIGDTVTVKHSKLNVEGTAIVNRIEYDVLAEKNLAVDVGNVKASFTDKVNDVGRIVDKVDEIDKNANQAIRAANGKNTIYYGPDEPTTGNVDDIWFRVVDGEYTRTYRFDGIQWQLIMSKDVKDIEEKANSAHNRADEAVEKAELATSNANEAIAEAQTAFDEAQSALSTAGSALDLATSIRGNMTTLSEMVDEHTGEISTIKQSVQGLRTDVADAQGNASSALQIAKGLQTRVTDAEGNISSVTQLADTLQSDLRDAEGNISTLQQTATDYARRLESAEGDISSVTQLANGLQTRVTDAEGNISSVTQLANALQTDLRDAEGNINNLTETASSMQRAITSVRDDLDGLEIGGRNILGNSKKPRLSSNNNATHPLKITGFDDFIRYEPQNNTSFNTYSTLNNSNHPIYEKDWVGKSMVVSVTVRVSKDTTFRFRFADWGRNPQTIHQDWFNVKASDGWVTLKMPIPKKSVNKNPGDDYIRFFLYTNNSGSTVGQPYNGTIDVKDWFIGFGTKVPDWSPAPEDLATQSQITQLSNNINARVQKGDVINQINIDTTGILIDGQKVHITGQTTIDDASIHGAKIVDASIGNAQIGHIDAAKINSGELNTNNITIFGGNALDYTFIDGSYFESRGRFSRTWRGSTKTHDIKLRFQNGYLRARNDTEDRSLYFSDYGVSTAVDGDLGGFSSGTLEFFSNEYSEARGVTLHSHYGVAALKSEQNTTVIDSYASNNINSKTSSIYLRPMRNNRPGTNEFRFWVKNNSSSYETDGVLTYGNPSSDTFGGGLRFSKSSNTNTIYATNNNGDIGTGKFHADKFIGSLNAPATHAYITTAYDGRLRVTDRNGYNNGNPNYTGIQTREILANSLRVNSGNLFLGTSSGEVKVTDNLLYNGGNTNFRPIRARRFNTDTSLREKKKDIELYSEDTLATFRNADIYLYHRLNDTPDDKLQLGMMIDEMPSVTYSESNDSFDLYALTSYIGKGLKDTINYVDDTKEELILKIARLEARLNKLEAA